MVSKDNFIIQVTDDVKKLKKNFGYPNEGDAFTHYALKLIYNLSDEKAADCTLVGGPGDKKVDAFWYDQQNNEAYIIQAKYSSAIKPEKIFDETPINECVSAYHTLRDADPTKLSEDLREISAVFKDSIRRCANINLITIIFGEFSKTARIRMQTLNKTLESENVTIEGITISDLLAKYESDLIAPSDFPSDAIIASDAFVVTKGSGKTLIGIVPVIIAGQWYKNFGAKLFQKNVRENLRERNPVNNKIEKTLRDKKERGNFLYYNNGLTITCEKLDFDLKTKKIDLTKFQVVNGCQTVCSIARSMNYDDDIDAQIFIKITETQDEKFQNAIAQNTNTQTAVLPRDLCSIDDIQRKLFKQFSDIGFFYDKRRGEFNELYGPKRAKRTFGADYRSKVISNEEAAVAFISFFGNPVTAYTKANKLIDKLEDFYYEIFPNDRDIYELLVPWQLYQKIEQKRSDLRKQINQLKGKKQEELSEVERQIINDNKFIKHANTYITACFGYLISRKYNIDNINQISGREDFKKLFELVSNQDFFDTYYEQIVADLRMFFDTKSKEPDFEPRNFFKRPNAFDEIKQHILSYMQLLKSRKIDPLGGFKDWPKLIK